MTTQPDDIRELLLKIRYDATAIQAKVTDTLNALNELNLPKREQTLCPKCGAGFKGPMTLAEHLHNSHEGPVPEHWLAIEARSHEPEQDAT